MTTATRTRRNVRPRIAPSAHYRMDVEGIVLASLEASLFIRPDGQIVSARATVDRGNAHLQFRLHSSVGGGWRVRLARRILGLTPTVEKITPTEKPEAGQ